MRALWTAATGMKAQQLNIDNISNNLANVSTTSFKKQRMEFKDLLYVNMQNSSADGQGNGTPVNIQIGHGVMPTANTRIFENGNFEPTGIATDIALDGPGFFQIQRGNETLYTRDGSFKLGLLDEETQIIVTSEGYPLLDENDAQIEIPRGSKDLTIDENGNVRYRNLDGETEEAGKIKTVEFINPSGLQAVGRNFYTETLASGPANIIEDDDRSTRLIQNYLETSNVQIVDEMVKMITTQRAYEINSKAIQTSDDMLQMANNLRR